MIRYTLHCAEGHDFESWFADAGGFEALASAGRLACPVCGGKSVEKALMAPAVRASRKAALAAPSGEVEAALAALRRQVEENSEYVGMNFVAEARRIHEGEAPERTIHGEARPDEARRLIEDGVPVAPLPFLPARKVN